MRTLMSDFVALAWSEFNELGRRLVAPFDVCANKLGSGTVTVRDGERVFLYGRSEE